MFGKIVIGVDGRQGGRDAIALARHPASPDASFTLVYVYGRGPISWWRHQLGEERPYDREASMLATERERAGIQAGIACVPDASPAAGLHDLADTIAADLIVVGASRHTLPGRVLLGDDASASLHGAPCPIAVAPRGYTRSAFPCSKSVPRPRAGSSRPIGEHGVRYRDLPSPATADRPALGETVDPARQADAWSVAVDE